MKLRLLISGSTKNDNTIGSFISRYLDASVAFDVLTFHDQFYNLLRSSFYKALYRFFPGVVITKMDALFISQVKFFKPDVVVVFKGMEISKRSLIQIRELGVKLVNYNFDHPFLHFSRGTGNRFVTEAIPYYDLHISYSSVIAQQLKEHYGVPTSVIPFGFHLTDEQFSQVLQANRPEIKEVCFVGNPDVLRIQTLRELMQENLRVHVYGFGWEKYLEPSELLVIHPPQKSGSFWSDPLEFWKVLRQYRVQLNFFRPHNEGSHNLRTFEVPAVGGILVTPDSAEQRLFFEPEREVFFYTNDASLISLCKRLLTMDEAEIRRIRLQAREKSIYQDYSYKRRTNDLLAVLNNVVINNTEKS